MVVHERARTISTHLTPHTHIQATYVDRVGASKVVQEARARAHAEVAHPRTQPPGGIIGQVEAGRGRESLVTHKAVAQCQRPLGGGGEASKEGVYVRTGMGHHTTHMRYGPTAAPAPPPPRPPPAESASPPSCNITPPAPSTPSDSSPPSSLARLAYARLILTAVTTGLVLFGGCDPLAHARLFSFIFDYENVRKANISFH
jgi:hypothetical protein